MTPPLVLYIFPPSMTTATESPVREQEICRDTLLEKYAKNNEASIDEVRRRVARALAQVDDLQVHGRRRIDSDRFTVVVLDADHRVGE